MDSISNITEQHHDIEMAEVNQENNQNSTFNSENVNVGSPEHENSIVSNETEIVSPDREYFFGNDKLHGGRMWIQTYDDPTKFNLYAMYNHTDNEDFYKCIQCTRYEHRGHKSATITVRHLGDGKTELSEKRNHYPSCNHDKSFIDKIQKKYHRTPRSTPNGQPKATPNAQPRATPNGQPRTKTPLQKTSTSRPSLQRQVLPELTTEEPKKRRSARLSQNESEVNGVVPATVPPVDSRPFFIKPSSAAPETARRSRTLAPPRNPLPSQNARVARDDSVASNFSHLFPSFNARTNGNSSQSSRPPLAAFSRVNAAVIPLKPVDLRPLPSSSRISTPTQVNIPTPPPIQYSFNKPYDLPQFSFLTPRILNFNESFCYCIPSTYALREMSALVGLEYKPQNQVFWHSTYIIHEITGRSKPSITQSITMSRNIGFQALSLFLTSSEDSTFKIQECVKQYIHENLHKYVNRNDIYYDTILRDALCGYQLENIHLYFLHEILNIRIVVLNGKDVRIFGGTFDDSIPSILLQKQNGEYLPVLSVQK